MIGNMMFFRSMLWVCPAACLLAQTPPPAQPNATPVPKPTVTFSPAAPAAMPTVAPDKVIITVGDQKITAAQFDEIIEALPQQYRAPARGSARKQFADNLVRILVLSQEGKKRGLDGSAEYKTQVQFQSANILAGMTYEEMGKEVKIDDAELRKYYDEHRADFDQVHARHILVRMKGSPLPVKPGQKDLTDEEALAKAQDLKKKLDGGADFADLAKQESDDTGSGPHGGDLGFFHHNQMVPAFADAAFKMKPGEVSEPVKSQFGYHIIKVEAVKSFDELKPEIEKKVRPEMAAKALEELQKKDAVELDPVFFAPPAAPHVPSLLPGINHPPASPK
jgi:peptidyl-prolyl cis-trans isomerase C